MAAISFRLNEKLFLRDPLHTVLGQNIISKSTELIHQLGFEQFTFKKLAEEITSTEASVYRYFESKYRLLHYLMAWYWNWMDYRIDLATSGLSDPAEQLRAAMHIITEEKKSDPAFEFINEELLHRIVIAEHGKTFLTKWVDQDNDDGFFDEFKIVCHKLAAFVARLNPAYPFPNSLICTMLIAVNQQQFFIEHLHSLSDITHRESRIKQHQHLKAFAEQLIFSTIKK